ncbi:MAG TPA: alpha/beta hydrolase [Symbiobacteriaceae bacterium]|jgi:pimeloyl-ACP methyl ester carboxylesterase
MPQIGHQYYEEHGQGFPLVLLHGHTLDRRMWADLIPPLATRFRVITPDLAGHGRSGQAPDGDALADDLAGLLKRLSIPRAAVCGLSMGGGIAVSFALHYPEMCGALVPVDAALFGWQYTDWPGTRPYVKIARSEGLAPALAAWLADPLFAPVLASGVGPQVRQIVSEFPGEIWLRPANPPAPPGRPEVDRLGEIGAPTLVVVGERDLPDFRRMADKLAAEVPGARLAVVPGAGHLVPLEAPAALSALLLEFLTPLSGA